MATIWGIHNDHPQLHIEDLGIVTIGWDEVGDLSQLGQDREAIKAKVAAAFPHGKPGAIPVWAGVLYRFAYEILVGDIIIYPYKPDSTLFFGKVSGDYEYDAAAEFHRNRRKVDWFIRDVPRTLFSQPALNEIGAAVTVFRVKNHAAEFEAFIAKGWKGGESLEAPVGTVNISDDTDTAVSEAEEAISASRIDEYTRDFILKTLLTSVGAYEFEEFVAALLESMGYRAEVTQKSADGGVDVIASQDPLGLGPPVIKVQCKRTVATIGSPEVHKLFGTLAGGQQGLFVTLGAYSAQAQQEARAKEGVKLVGGREIVELVLENYERLDDKWRRLLPLRSVYAVDADIGGN
jgi:restriction system protein